MEPGDERPRVVPIVGTLDRVLEVCAAAVLVTIVAGSLVSYSRLPDQVPIHFDLSGTPDRWGSRATIFMLPVIAAVVYAIMTAVSRIKPWYWNIPAKVTEENAVRVYAATARLMRVVKLEVMALVGMLLWLVVASAHAGRTTEGWMPLVGAVSLVATVFAGMVVVRRRARAGSGALGGSCGG